VHVDDVGASDRCKLVELILDRLDALVDPEHTSRASEPSPTMPGVSALSDVLTTITAAASAVAAGAAWRSSAASSAASRDAREALALGIAPELQLSSALDVDSAGEPTGVLAQVYNLSGWTATDLDLEIHYRNGPTDRQHRARMDTMPHGHWDGPPNEHIWSYRLAVGVGGSDGYDDYRAKIARIVLAYSDQHGIARYEASMQTIANGRPVEYRARRIS
jgi:hypothetical protein